LLEKLVYEFIESQLAELEKISKMLRDEKGEGRRVRLDALHALITWCYQATPMYLAQGIDPEIMAPKLRRLDNGIKKELIETTSINIDKQNKFTKMRMSQPKRLGGMGVRNTAETCRAAFAGRCLDILPMLIDRKEIIKSVLAGEEMTLTIIHKGLAPHLEEIIGKGAFDQGENQGGKAPLETFLNSKTQTAKTLQKAFDEIKNMTRVEGEEICRWTGENMDDPCTLTGNELKNAINPDDLGKKKKKVSTQRRLQEEIEEGRARTLQKWCDDYRENIETRGVRAGIDRQITSYIQTKNDKFSRAFIAYLPYHGNQAIGGKDQWEMYRRYFGLPSHACKAFEGTKYNVSIGINGNSLKGKIDAFGDTITKLMTMGNELKLRHDGMKWCMSIHLSEAQISHRCEYPEFRHCFDLKNEGHATRGIIPDIKIIVDANGAKIGELKVIGYTETSYFPKSNKKQSQDDDDDTSSSSSSSSDDDEDNEDDSDDEYNNYSQPTKNSIPIRFEEGEPVKRRADKIRKEYDSKAKNLDREHNEGRSRVQSHLKSVGPVLTWVVGAFGECSKDMHKFVTMVSRESAKKHWQKFMGAQNEEEAFGIIKARKYKQIGVKASLIHAQCVRNQLHRVLEGTNETKWGGTTSLQAEKILHTRTMPQDYYQSIQGGGW